MKKWIFILFLILIICQKLIYYPQLPQQITTGFNIAGAYTKTCDKYCLFLSDILITLLSIFFIFLPQKAEKYSFHYRKIPNADYWYSEKNKKITKKYFEQHTTKMGYIILLILLFLDQSIINYHISPDKRIPLPHPLFCVTFFIIIIVIWCYLPILRFKKIN